MLSDLVKAFRMTRLEAKEFFSAALSPAPEVTSETEKADSEILAQQLSLLKNIRLPGFLTDYYGDIIAALATRHGLIRDPRGPICCFGGFEALLAIHAAGQRSFTTETRWRIMAQVQASKDPRASGAFAPDC
jgi:hypothetical protein